jgi:hypothetical protein
MNPRLERYLDRLFDLLSGTGAAGRRTLTETEAHLTEHIEDLIAQGRTVDIATQEALARFGAPEVVAAAVTGPEQRMPLLLHEAVGSLWIFVASMLITAGIAGALCWIVGCVFGAAFMAPASPMTMDGAQACAALMERYPAAADCMDAAMLQNFDSMVIGALTSGVAGGALLGLYFAAKSSARFERFTALPPKGSLFSAGVIAFGFASHVWFIDGIDDYQRSVAWDWSHDFARGTASLVTALFFALAAYKHLSTPQRPKHPPIGRAA